MGYEVSITSDAEAFAAVTGAFLRAELEREQLARVLADALRGRYAEHPNHFATVLASTPRPNRSIPMTPNRLRFVDWEDHRFTSSR